MGGREVNALPEFATNRPAGDTVAAGLNQLLSELTKPLKEPPAIAIASAYFNIAGYQQLAAALDGVGPARLLLGAEPTDANIRTTVTPLAVRQARRGDPILDDAVTRHAAALAEDRNLLGFTREADAGAQQFVDWLRTHPVEVRRLESDFLHGKAFIVASAHGAVLAGSSNFTYAGLMRNRELNLGVYTPHAVGQVSDWFDEQWNDAVAYDLAGLYESRWLPHQPTTVFLRMLYELYGLEPTEQAGEHELHLAEFQRDGVRRARRILGRWRGVLIADEVGLGKTFIAGEMIHDAAIRRRQRVLVVASATLRDSTWNPFLQDKIIPATVVSYEELVHELDEAGKTGGKLASLDDYAMVVVDEAHNLRNAATQRAEAMRRLLGGGVPKDLLLLTATPVNNGLADLQTLISYITPSDSAFSEIGIPSVNKYFQRAMAIDPDELTGAHLFELLDAVAVRRTRRFIRTQYPNASIRVNGQTVPVTFPDPVVRRVDYRLDALLPGFFDDLAVALGADVEENTASLATGVILDRPGTVLTMARYVPSRFRRGTGVEQYQVQNAGLLRSALLKRFESSAIAFVATLNKMVHSHSQFLSALDLGYVLQGDALRAWASTDSDAVTDIIGNESADDARTGPGLGADVMAGVLAGVNPDNARPAAKFDDDALRDAVTADRDLLLALRDRVGRPDPRTDPKIISLIEEIATISAEATGEGIALTDQRNKRKVLVFTYFTDTAKYIVEALRERSATDDRLAAYRDRIVIATGQDAESKQDAIVGFAPETAGRPGDEDLYDIAVSTDVLSEGVNLQQARHIINYDLPWNPMRLVQRYGRVDRIGSKHSTIYLRCFFPDRDLERLLGLEERLQRKLKQAAAAFGTSEVLPGMESVDRVMAETRAEIDAIYRGDTTPFSDSRSASASSEEFQRRLVRAFESSQMKTTVLGLPWGAGTGMVREGAEPGVVFCARVADHDRPFFRYVPLDPDTFGVRYSGGQPLISRELLACLEIADPGDESLPPDLPDALRQAAFDAWAVAQQDVYDAWTLLTDPAALQAPVPAVMRQAAELIRDAGAFLPDQDSLARTLEQSVDNRIQRAIRDIIRGPGGDQEHVEALRAAAQDLRLTEPPPVKPYPPIELEDVRPISWIAVHSGKDAEPTTPAALGSNAT